MFPTRFFGDRFFAPRYYPKVGADAAPVFPGNPCFMSEPRVVLHSEPRPVFQSEGCNP